MPVSHHAKQRIKERIGVPKKSTERTFELALKRGLHHRDATGNLHKWMTSQITNKKGVQGVIYNQKLFLYNSKEILITVITVPNNLAKLVKICSDKSLNKE